MTDNVAVSDDAASQRAAEQARLRKERREAKIKAGGSARLNKITGMGGRVTGDSDQAAQPSPEANATSPQAAAPAAESQAQQPYHNDPDEVDISEHFYAPQSSTPRREAAPSPGGLSEAQLRQMMLGLDRPGQQQQPQQQIPDLAGATEDDPIMKMMTQMMAGAGGANFPPGSAPPFPGMPPMPQSTSAQKGPDPYTALWRLLHALVALGLGLYIALKTPFTGTHVEREREALAATTGSEDPFADEMERSKRLFFWAFATAEAVLLTTRLFILPRGAGGGGSGMAWTVVGFLPEPFKGYITVALRYGQIFSTVRADILVCMFVLGVCSWWRS